MAETFYGPWRLVVTQADSFPPQVFVISGSANADGRYLEQPPFNLDVYGTEWTVELAFGWMSIDPPSAPSEEDVTWEQSEVRRAMEFVPGQGLTVTLNSHREPSAGIGPYYAGMILTCISLDPNINPTPSANANDFTIPEG